MKNTFLNKSSKLRVYLQGDNPNLVGTILAFHKDKIVKSQYNNLTGEVLQWFSYILFFDHLTGRIERYDINNSDRDKQTRLKMQENFGNVKSPTSIERVFYLTFLMNLYANYFDLRNKGRNSYDDPYFPEIFEAFKSYNNSKNKEKEKQREEIIYFSNLTGKPVLVIPQKFYNIALITSSIAERFDISNNEKSIEPQVIKELKSRMNSKRIKSVKQLTEEIQKFNKNTSDKIKSLAVYDNKNSTQKWKIN
jgi:hypothetical protein